MVANIKGIGIGLGLAAMLVMIGSVQGQVIYSNLSSTPPGYNDSTAYTVSTGGSYCNVLAAAVRFKPTVSALFEDAKLALANSQADGASGSPNQVTVSLETDVSDTPGVVLESIDATNLQVAPSSSIITVTSVTHTPLVAGTYYWLVVSTSSSPSSCDYWYYNSSGDDADGTNFSLDYGSWFLDTNTTDPRPAFEVDGIPPGPPPPPVSGNGAPFQIRYVSNLAVGDSVIDITNDGQTTPVADPVLPSASNLCVGVYTFDANEELQSCCACLVTPNGLASLSAQAINATSLTGEKPTSLVVKLLAWSTTAGASSTAPPGTPAPPTSTSCNPAMPGSLSGGMHAWGTTIHALPSGNRSTYTVSETEFSPALLSAAEYAHITESCEFNQINGSAQSGQCKGCASGGQ